MTPREQAQRLRHRFYDGEVCSRNSTHGRQRYASTGHCVVCMRARARSRKAMLAKPKRSPRSKAIFHGRKTYYSGKPCGRGHNSPRFTSSRICVECDREHKDRTGLLTWAMRRLRRDLGWALDTLHGDGAHVNDG